MTGDCHLDYFYVNELKANDLCDLWSIEACNCCVKFESSDVTISADGDYLIVFIF